MPPVPVRVHPLACIYLELQVVSEEKAAWSTSSQEKRGLQTGPELDFRLGEPSKTSILVNQK